jgi:leucyl-tRNA synthetase
MMICINEIDKAGTINIEDFKKFLQILAPFAPHVADELWTSLGEKKSIHTSSWPTYNAKKIVDDTVTIGIQVNGKVRAEITIGLDESIRKCTIKSISNARNYKMDRRKGN